MTKFQKLMAVTLLTGLLGSGWAQAGGRHYSPHHSYHRHSSDWILPAVVGGLVVYSVTQPRVVYSEPVYVQRAPVVIAPPPPPQPLLAQNLPPVWYFCSSSQTYYPYVQSCQEGWKVVPATPAH